MIPKALAVRRVVERAAQGGHSVPEAKVRSRFRRLWKNVKKATTLADETYVYDNTSARRPFRVVAHYQVGVPVMEPGVAELVTTGFSRMLIRHMVRPDNHLNDDRQVECRQIVGENYP